MKISKLVKVAAKAAQAVKSGKAVKPTVVKEKAMPKVGSLLYKFLAGCALFLANIRKADITGTPFVALPKSVSPAVAWAKGTYGTCLSMVQAAGNTVALPEKELGFDMTAVGGECLNLKAALARAKREGKAHTIHRHTAKKGVNEEGFIIGSMDDMYVGWVTKAGHCETLETKAIADGRNKARLFDLVK